MWMPPNVYTKYIEQRVIDTVIQSSETNWNGFVIGVWNLRWRTGWDDFTKWLLFSSIFDAMNFHFPAFFEIRLQYLQKMPEIHCTKNTRN